jgi:hypothetical protein
MAIQIAGTAGLIGALLVMLYDVAWSGGSSLQLVCRRHAGERPLHLVLHGLRTTAFALITPLLEKNVVKRMSVEAPMVLSMSRLVVLAFAVGLMRQLWYSGIAGWPDATLAMAVVLALPLLGAFERATPEQMIDLANALISRFGIGDVRKLPAAYSREPLKTDDHRAD